MSLWPTSEHTEHVSGYSGPRAQPLRCSGGAKGGHQITSGDLTCSHEHGSPPMSQLSINKHDAMKITRKKKFGCTWFQTRWTKVKEEIFKVKSTEISTGNHVLLFKNDGQPNKIPCIQDTTEVQNARQRVNALNMIQYTRSNAEIQKASVSSRGRGRSASHVHVRSGFWDDHEMISPFNIARRHAYNCCTQGLFDFEI